MSTLNKPLSPFGELGPIVSPCTIPRAFTMTNFDDEPAQDALLELSLGDDNYLLSWPEVFFYLELSTEMYAYVAIRHSTSPASTR